MFPASDEDPQLLAVRKAAGFVEFTPEDLSSAWSKYGVPVAPMAKTVRGGNRDAMAKAIGEESKGKEASLISRFKMKGKTL